jgi:transcriptional regulator with PAS, ATPase and Fis domain
VGLIETANNSTLFLDEIGAMPLEFQTRFLKFLDDGYILPLGSREKKWVNVRVIAATNLDLSKQVADGKFREDLFYRLSLMPFTIPPLRERREDVNILIDVFLDNFRNKYQKKITIEQDVRKQLLNYSYPGNVRELKNIMERLAILAKNDIIDSDILPPQIIQYSMQHNTQFDTLISRPLRTLVADYENRIIENLMTTYKSTYKVAEILGVSQPTIVRKMHHYKDTANVKARKHKEG